MAVTKYLSSLRIYQQFCGKNTDFEDAISNLKRGVLELKGPNDYQARILL